MENKINLPLEHLLELNGVVYKIIEFLGHGGSSIVYRAKSPDGFVVIKEVFPTNLIARITRPGFDDKDMTLNIPDDCKASMDTYKTRAGLEFKHARKLRLRSSDGTEDNRIAKYKEPFKCNNTSYTVIENSYRGKMLSTMMWEENSLANFPDFMDVCEQILRILEALNPLHNHEDGAHLHRDISPDNVFVFDDTETGERLTHLIDFNSVYEIDSEEEDQLLSIKEAYSPPELDRRSICYSQKLTKAADLYSVAVIFFELLMGRVPNVDDYGKWAHGVVVVNDLCKYADSLAEVTKKEVNEVLKKGLQIVADNRYKDIGKMYQAITDLLRTHQHAQLKEGFAGNADVLANIAMQSIDLKKAIRGGGEQHNIPFTVDESYKLDTSILSRTEMSDINQAFNDGYKIAVLWGLPDCGKSYIAQTYANTYREQFPIVKSLGLKRVSKGQNLAALVISARAWYFDKGIGDTGTPEEQFNNKLLAFNKVNQGKLIIISGINEIHKEDIESLKELKSNFIICTESNISDPSVKSIPVKTISYDEALKLFKHYNDTEIQEESLKDVFAMLEYHVGLIRFIAKQMQQYSLSANDVKEKFNTSDVTRMRVDTGLDTLTLAEYCKAMFSFSGLSREDISLLTLMSLLPAQNHSVAFFEEYFNRPKLELINDAIPLSKKGYINYDAKGQTIKSPFLVAKAFLESDLFDVDIAKDVLVSIYDILEHEGCKDFSVIQDKLNYGVVAAEKLSSINSFDDADLCLKIASGYKDLCFIDDAQKYAELAIQLREDKKTTLQVMHFKVDIMIFRFDYRSTVDYLESQINQMMWDDFTGKEKGEILYKTGLVYNFLKLSDKSAEYFKRGFYTFKEDECIVGEFVCVAALLRSSAESKVYEQELRLFIEDGKALAETDPFWSFIAYAFTSPIGDILTEARFNIQNVTMDKLMNTIDDMDDAQGGSFINTIEEIFSRLKRKSDAGGTLEQSLCDFFEILEETVERWVEDEEVDKVALVDALVRYISEALNKLREINIPLNTEIEMLRMIAGSFLSDMAVIDKRTLEAKALQLFEQRYNALLPTVSEKLLATQSYAQIIAPQKAVSELEQQIELLENHLPQEHRYPLASLYEELAYRYNDLTAETKEKEYHEKCTKCIINSIDTLKTIPETCETQARLFRYIRDDDSAINVLESNGIASCQLCVTYFDKAKELLSKRKWDNEIIDNISKFYNKLQYFRASVPTCSSSCYASALYEIGKKITSKRIRCTEDDYEILLQRFRENNDISVFINEYDTSDDSEIKNPAFWFEKAAEAEHTDSLYEMGRHCCDVEQDYRTAFIWFEKAAIQGHNKSQFEVCFYLYGGIGVAENIALAYEWFERAKESISDENLKRIKNYFDEFMSPNSPKIQFQIGWCYDKEELVEKNQILAEKWYAKAATQGQKNAQNSLGFLYENGYADIPSNYEKAIEMYRLSAEQGYSWAQTNLGWMHEKGKGVPQNYSIASEFYLKAAEQGHSFAQYNLARLLKLGLGVPIDAEQAVLWYQKSADQGYSWAQYEMGKCFYDGIGIEQNRKAAKDYFDKATEQKHIDAKQWKEKCFYNRYYERETIQGVNINNIYQDLQDWDVFEVSLVGNDKIVLNTGCMYDDMTEMVVDIYNSKDKIVVTDGGHTHDYLNNTFELDEPDVIKNISAITEYFGITYENKIFSIEADDTSKVPEIMLKLFYCIGFLNTMKIFYV